MHLFYQPDQVSFLTEDDSRHAVKTLRLGVGDGIAVTDGHGNRHSAVITQADSRRCGFRIIETQTTPSRPFSIRICVAPTKNIDRIEWFVEKAVEIGIERISFFFGQHSERRVLKLERIEKIAIAAMKQSLQSYLPQLDEAVSFSDLLETVNDEQRFIAHLPDNSAPTNLAKIATAQRRYVVLIGPEGDFSEKEIQQAVAAGFQMVTLGPNRLRTETAALTACQLLNFLNV
ncbi:16S rRNA (uracil(1498)-N(3))-methyltransferase [Spirosoma terrae]|uniref:Ribosomal RNA small subunit methyltransferase E n=1 Tax=Spirosoma terrae TaxID=1968276 RepID=A0A6L9LCK1_9BACT|nr:16S rRNA (uracil(1498)-N(3))-methyltransferase [Spirosoma terrae]NDU98284.1 16S rRNA (uracil(1498)-N(3))-methyltransferase [Spirosoma terrae]